MPYSIDFNVIAEVLALYYEHRNSLFSEQIIGEKVGSQLTMIKTEIRVRTNASPEQLVKVLEPEVIKRIISKTVDDINNEEAEYPDVRIIPMSDKEWENGGGGLSINYQFSSTAFGPIIIASTDSGVCYLAFSDEGSREALEKLQIRFPNATFGECSDDFQQHALGLFDAGKVSEHSVLLHLKGTPFQIKTWKKLLKIPFGGLISYSALTDDPKNAHALGAAVGSNPIAYIIPCHRTVRASGEFGDYHWGSNRKAALICLEAANRVQLPAKRFTAT